MALYDLNRSQLSSLLLSNNIDHSVTKSVINYLVDDGLLHGHTVAVQEGGAGLDPSAQVLIVDSPTAAVAIDPNLMAIVDIADADLTVTGSGDLLIATGSDDDKVDLSGATGDLRVMTGSGNDTIVGGGGSETLVGGGGNDSIEAGSGDHQLLVGDGTNFDTLPGGDHDHGHNDRWLDGVGHAHDHDNSGFGNDTLVGGSGNWDTLVGGGGNDVLIGGAGTNQLLIGGGGNDTFFAGTGGDTLMGGAGNDTFNVSFVDGAGNDTIVGGGGHDKVVFDVAYADATISTHHGTTTVAFGDGQTMTISGVEQLVFTDQTVKPHS